MNLLSAHPVPVLVLFVFVQALWLAAPGLAQARVAPAAEPAVARIEAVRRSGELPETMLVEGTYRVFFEGAPNDEPVAQGKFEDAFAGADRARHASDMGPFGKLERGVTPELAWEVDPSLGAKRYDGPAGATVRRYFQVLRGASPRGLYREIAVAGTREVDGVECSELAMTPAHGKADRWFVDQDGYVRRLEIALPSPDSAGAVFDMEETMDSVLLFGDWKRSGDVAYPGRRELRMGPAKVVLQVEKVTAGVEFAAERFAPPAAVTRLKPKVQGQPLGGDAPVYTVVEREAQPVMSIRVTCRPDELAKTMGILLPEVMAHITAAGGKIAGAPFSRYHAFADDEVDLEAGIPVAKPVEEKGRVKRGELPAGKVLTAWHIGPYDLLSKAHQALQAHAAQAKMTARGGPWEVYWTDPGMVPDPAKWRTQLFLPIE